MFIKYIKIVFLLTIITVNAQAEKLGYLFTSESQRETLNTVRDQYQRGLYEEGKETSNQLGYKFNGVISKKGRAKTLWVNGSLVNSAKSSPNVRGEYQIELPLGQVQIKPGQIYQPSNAKVIEAFDEEGAGESE